MCGSLSSILARPPALLRVPLPRDSFADSGAAIARSHDILEGVEEAQDLAFLLIGERIVSFGHVRGLDLMALDRFLFGE